MSLKLPSDFAKTIAQVLSIPESKVDDYFEIGETKDGYFYAKRKKSKWLEQTEFKTMCSLARDYSGEYIKDQQTWRVPGPFAKKGPVEGPSEAHTQTMRGPSEKVTTTTPSVGVPQDATLSVKLGYYEKFAVSHILSPAFTLRLNIQEDIEELIEQIGTTKAGEEYGVILQPLICRPAKTPGYVEVGAGERRLLSAKTLGLGVVPVVIKNFSDEEFDRIRLMENVARKDLSDYELARYIKYLMETHPHIYPSQATIADVFGKTQQWVSQHLSMLQLEKDNIITRVILEKTTEAQAREILAAPSEKR